MTQNQATLKPAHKRILLKLSGEALMGDDAFGINPVTIDSMVSEIAQVVALGIEMDLMLAQAFEQNFWSARNNLLSPHPSHLCLIAFI